MNNQRILALVLLIGALGIPLGLTAGSEPPKQTESASPAQTTAGRPAPSKTSEGGTAQTPKLSFEILDSTSPIVVPIRGNKEGKIALTINNNGTEPIAKWYSFISLRNDEGVAIPESDVWVTVSPEEPLPVGDPREFQFTFHVPKDMPRYDDEHYHAAQNVSGFLFIQGDNELERDPKTQAQARWHIINKPVQLVSAMPSIRSKWLILSGLIIALIISLISAILLRDKLDKSVVIPDWSKGSLMTNFTIFGTIFTALTAAWGLVTQPHLLQKGEYIVNTSVIFKRTGLAKKAKNWLNVSVQIHVHQLMAYDNCQ